MTLFVVNSKLIDLYNVMHYCLIPSLHKDGKQWTIVLKFSDQMIKQYEYFIHKSK